MWFNEFLNKYKAGISHEFLFYFNIRDLLDNQRYYERYIYEEFAKYRKFSIVGFFDISKGLRFMDSGMEREFNKITSNKVANQLNSYPSKIFPYMNLVLKNTKALFLIDHIEKIIPTGDIGSLSYEERIGLLWVCQWSTDTKISSVGSTILLSADNIEDVNREIFKSSYRVEPILVQLPSENERKSYIKYLLEDEKVKTNLTIDEFAKLSSGLNRKSIKDIKLRAEAEDVPISFEFIKEKKHSVLKKEYGDVLEFIYPEIGFDDIGGMENAKKYLKNNVIKPILKGDLRRVPMGILLCGPSGTGKTLLVNALAKASGFNCVQIDMSRILGQYVGESEKNFKKCLLGARSQEPVIVFVDEIDTTFRRGESGDSGVGRNIFNEFLQFTSNTKNRGKVLFIAATNRPDILDPALKRAGRFDKKIPILLPDENEREAIFKIMFDKYNFETTINDFSKYSKMTENYTGAEIEIVVRKAYELSNENEDKCCKIDDLVLTKALKKCRPSTQEIESMTLLAINEVDDIDLLPERYWRYLGDS